MNKTNTANEEEFKKLDTYVDLIASHEKPQRLYSIREMFKAALKLAKESPGTLNLKIASTVLKELRYSFKMFYPNRHTQKITIFGSARTPPSEPLYALARTFAQQAVKRGYMVITGGGPGVMAAGNEGAGHKRGFGLNIRLPQEQSANPFINEKDNLIHFKYFFTRKLFLVKEASAFALFPGGFGTMDETFEVLTLIQTGKSNLIPILFMDVEGSGYWQKFIEFLESELMARGLISESDRYLFQVFHNEQQALDHVDQFYKNYHSMRLVKDKLVLRLKSDIPDSAFKEIQKRFSHLSANGKFTRGGPLPEESNEPELADLVRLILAFDRTDFCGLRPLIDFLNENAV